MSASQNSIFSYKNEVFVKILAGEYNKVAVWSWDYY